MTRKKTYWFNGHCRFYNKKKMELVPPHRGYCEKKKIYCGGVFIPIGQYCTDGEYTKMAIRRILQAGGIL